MQKEFLILATGKGMLPVGIPVGNVFGRSIGKAYARVIRKMLGKDPRRMIFKLQEVKKR